MFIFLVQKYRRIVFKFWCMLWRSLVSFLIASLAPSNQMANNRKYLSPQNFVPRRRSRKPSQSDSVIFYVDRITKRLHQRNTSVGHFMTIESTIKTTSD